MGEWIGLHNEDKHRPRDGYTICIGAYCTSCAAERLCHCCLESEVEELRGVCYQLSKRVLQAESRLARITSVLNGDDDDGTDV